AQLGVERAGQDGPLLDQDRLAVVPRQDRDAGARAADAGRADQDQVDGGRAPRAGLRPDPVERRARLDLALAGLERLVLPAVGVALDIDVDQPQRPLRWSGDVRGEEDGARAGPEDWRAPRVQAVQ